MNPILAPSISEVVSSKSEQFDLSSPEFGILNFLPAEAARSARMLLYSHKQLMSLLPLQTDELLSATLTATAFSIASCMPSHYIYSQTLFDYALWESFTKHLVRFPLEITRHHWRIFFSIFPTAVEALQNYCKTETDAGNFREIMFLFERNSSTFLPQSPLKAIDFSSVDQHFRILSVAITMTECATVPLWMLYLDAAEKNAQSSGEEDDVAWARVHSSYIFAKIIIGQASDATPFWNRYVHFLENKIHPSIEQKELLRSVYQESLMSPIFGVTELMDPYMTFETNLLPKSHLTTQRKVTLGSDLQSAHQRATMTQAEIQARTVDEKQICWPKPVNYIPRRCDTLSSTISHKTHSTVPSMNTHIEQLLYQRYFQSNYDESPVAVSQYVAWRKRILFELANPLELRFTSDTWINRMTYIYSSALQPLRFHVDLWVEYAKFLLLHRRHERAIRVYERALEVFPTDIIIRCAYADALGSTLVNSPKQHFTVPVDATMAINELPLSKQRAVMMFQEYFAMVRQIRFSKVPVGSYNGQASTSTEIDQICAQVTSMYIAYIRWSHHALHHHARSHIVDIYQKMHQISLDVQWFGEIVRRTFPYVYHITKDTSMTDTIRNLCADELYLTDSSTKPAKSPASIDQECSLHFLQPNGTIPPFYDWCAKLQKTMQRENIRPKCSNLVSQIEHLCRTSAQRKSGKASDAVSKPMPTLLESALTKDPVVASRLFQVLGTTVAGDTDKRESQLPVLLQSICTKIQPEVLVVSKQGAINTPTRVINRDSPIHIEDTDKQESGKKLHGMNISAQEQTKKESENFKSLSAEETLHALLETLPAKVGCQRSVEDLRGKVPCVKYVINLLRSNPL